MGGSSFILSYKFDAALHKQIVDAVIPQEPILGVPKDPDAPKIVVPTNGQSSVHLNYLRCGIG